jgi:hypothetical protein
VAFSGNFSVFSHHIARDTHPGARQLHLGLLAHNRGQAPVVLKLTAGASYLSQPDALFKRLRPLLFDPVGEIFAGPGDRVAGELLRGKSPLPPRKWILKPGETTLLLNLPIPTNVAIPPPVNGRTTQLYLHSNGPLHLSEIAAFADTTGTGDRFKAPTLAEFQSLLAQNQRAGVLEAAATPYSPDEPAPRGFRYGRVAGVTRGAYWHGDLSPLVKTLAAEETVGFPIAAVHLNRLGIRQVQSAPLQARYPDTAFQGHGNYGVTYRLTVRLQNSAKTPQAYRFALSQPTNITPQGPGHIATYKQPPETAVTFRGLLRVDEKGGKTAVVPRFTHVVLRKGQLPPSFETVAVPGGEERELVISLIYPADATPPQLLTIQRI